MSNGANRFDVKAQAGWSRTRTDGSSYSRTTDEISAQAEEWFAEQYGGVHDDSVALRGDSGYDVVIDRRGRQLRVDVVHAGMVDGMPRDGTTSSLIVNLDSNKLVVADVLVLVDGPPFRAIGWIYTARFVATAQMRDHGFGVKYSLHARYLHAMNTLLGRR